MPLSLGAILKGAWAVLTTIPEIYKIVKELIAMLKEKPKDKQRKVSEAFRKQRKANTKEKKREAAKDIANVISGL